MKTKYHKSIDMDRFPFYEMVHNQRYFTGDVPLEYKGMEWSTGFEIWKTMENAIKCINLLANSGATFSFKNNTSVMPHELNTIIQVYGHIFDVDFVYKRGSIRWTYLKRPWRVNLNYTVNPHYNQFKDINGYTFDEVRAMYENSNTRA